MVTYFAPGLHDFSIYLNSKGRRRRSLSYVQIIHHIMKYIFTLTLFVVFSSNSNAQQLARLDSLITFKDTLFETPVAKHIYHYDEELKISQKDSVIYNAQGLVGEIIGFASINGFFYETSLTVLEYDSQGNNTRYLAQSSSSNNWSDLWEWRNTYDNGRISTSEFYSRDFVTEEWIISAIDEFIYDVSGNLLIENNSFDFDEVTLEKIPDRRRNFYYDEEGYLERAEYKRYDADSMTFMMTSFRDYVPDDYGNTLHSTSTIVNQDGEESLSSRSTNLFNTDIAEQQADIPVDITFQLFESGHIRLQNVLEEWEDEEWQQTWKMVYYYSGLTNTEESFLFNELKIFPNPTSSIINFSNDQFLNNASKVFQIINPDGRVVLEGKGNSNQLNIGELPSGMYHIKVGEGNSIFKSNFIKQ